MNKTIIININSIVFHIEEDAYETLRSYMIDIKRHFSQSADSGEILLDIENRIAEMFLERIQQGKKEVINKQDVEEVIHQMGRVSDFEDVHEFDADETYHQEYTTTSYTEKKLLRSADDVVVGGVCSGLGYYFGIQTKWVRVLFVLFVLMGGSGVLLYVVLWAVMPVATSRADRMAMRGEEPNLQNFKKNFEEELERDRDDYEGNQGPVVNTMKTVGSGVASILKFIGKAFLFLLLIWCGMSVFGMLVVLIGFGTAIFGVQSEMVFPGLDVLPQTQALIALLAGVLAITIPFLALFSLLVRLLFKTKPMNNYLSLSLWAGWIVSIMLVIFFVFLGAREFKEESTIKVEKQLASQPVYYFSEKDVRVINASTSENGKKIFKIDVEGETLSSYLKGDINIRFESLPAEEAPYIQYSYYAKGNSYQAATKRASEIDYLAKQENERITFDSHFSLGKHNEFRDQSVSAVVYLPIGARVVLDESLLDKLNNVNFYECSKEYEEVDQETKATEWIMQKSGLVCAPNFEVSDSDLASNDLEEAKKQLELAKERIEKSAKELEKKIELIEEKVESNATKSKK